MAELHSPGVPWDRPALRSGRAGCGGGAVHVGARVSAGLQSAVLVTDGGEHPPRSSAVGIPSARLCLFSSGPCPSKIRGLPTRSAPGTLPGLRRVQMPSPVGPVSPSLSQGAGAGLSQPLSGSRPPRSKAGGARLLPWAVFLPGPRSQSFSVPSHRSSVVWVSRLSL